VGLLFYPRRMFPADRTTLPKIAQTTDALPESGGKGVVSGTTDLPLKPGWQSGLSRLKMVYCGRFRRLSAPGPCSMSGRPDSLLLVSVRRASGRSIDGLPGMPIRS